MNKLYYIATVLAVMPFLPASGQKILGGKAQISSVNMSKVEDKIFVSMDIVPEREWNVKSNQVVVLSPVLENEDHLIKFPSIEIRGRKQYLYHLRDQQKENNAKVYRSSETKALHYEVSVPYEEWMENSMLALNEDLCGCCKTLLASGKSELKENRSKVFIPVFAYVVPKAEAVKVRSESGQAFVNFHVSKTDIDATYLNNESELRKILNTIDRCKNDKDIAITDIIIKGYASPEGKYADNERLAKGRTAAVSDYVKKRLANIGECPLHTSYEAENWEGLKSYIEESSLPEKSKLLAVINAPEFADNPDAREWKLKSTYPESYRLLLTDCYPTLRRTDYKVEFNVREFNTEEARELIKTQPQKLSLQEMYNVAQTYEPGSEEYNDVFETAVRMFPDDATANLNAANSALQRKDLVTAKKYITKAGNSGEAVVAQGIFAMMSGDAEAAEKLMRQAQEMGIGVASQNLEEILDFKR